MEFNGDETLTRKVTLECYPAGSSGGWSRLQVSGHRLNRHDIDCFDRIAQALEELQNGPSAEDRGFTFCPLCESKWRDGEIDDPHYAICSLTHDHLRMCQACREPFGKPIGFTPVH